MRKFKRLNRKGFTLIELLAVIVILAVVMGIAATSVIGVMNNSRKNGLQQGAAAVADSFRVAYAEAIMNGDTGNVLGVNISDTHRIYTLNEDVLKRLNITSTNYTVPPVTGTGASTGIVNWTPVPGATIAMTNSFIYVDNNNNIIACMIARPGGSYDLAQFRGNAAVATGITTTRIAQNGTIHATQPATVNIAANNMWACSNGTHSWT